MGNFKSLISSATEVTQKMYVKSLLVLKYFSSSRVQWTLKCRIIWVSNPERSLGWGSNSLLIFLYLFEEYEEGKLKQFESVWNVWKFAKSLWKFWGVKQMFELIWIDLTSRLILLYLFFIFVPTFIWEDIFRRCWVVILLFRAMPITTFHTEYSIC